MIKKEQERYTLQKCQNFTFLIVHVELVSFSVFGMGQGWVHDTAAIDGHIVPVLDEE